MTQEQQLTPNFCHSITFTHSPWFIGVGVRDKHTKNSTPLNIRNFRARRVRGRWGLKAAGPIHSAGQFFFLWFWSNFKSSFGTAEVSKLSWKASNPIFNIDFQPWLPRLLLMTMISPLEMLEQPMHTTWRLVKSVSEGKRISNYIFLNGTPISYFR
jgi:hypothetical protein